MRSIVIILTALILGVAGTMLTLHLLGKGPFNGGSTDSAETAEVKPGPGQVMVPVSVAPIAAYTRVTRDHLMDARRGRMAEVRMGEETARSEGVILDRSKIVGRVLRKDKYPIYAFTESDFLPEGTAAGIPAAVQPGMRAVILDASNVVGLHSLRQGDRFDLLAYVGDARKSSAAAAALLGDSSSSSSAKQAGSPRVLVTNGVIIQPTTVRTDLEREKGGLIGERETTKAKEVREITIGASAAEVPALTEAIAKGIKLIAVVRSGQPDAAGKDQDVKISQNALDEQQVARLAATPTPAPTPPPIVIEKIVGEKRENLVFPQTKQN